MARQARKNTNLVENLKEINYRFHTNSKHSSIICSMFSICQCLVFPINTKTNIFAMDHSCTVLDITVSNILEKKRKPFFCAKDRCENISKEPIHQNYIIFQKRSISHNFNFWQLSPDLSEDCILCKLFLLLFLVNQSSVGLQLGLWRFNTNFNNILIMSW